MLLGPLSLCQLLDFDFEKCCSVNLAPVNVYACLVCGKYYQVCGPSFHRRIQTLGDPWAADGSDAAEQTTREVSRSLMCACGVRTGAHSQVEGKGLASGAIHHAEGPLTAHSSLRMRGPG